MAKPIIGLALGGGVARGWAHIGVMRRLLKFGIVPDIVCGTSVGALVGGAYLAGHLDTLEDFARSLTKRRLLGLLDIHFGGSSLIGGKRLINLMQEHLGDLEIDDVERQFVAVTAELATGHEIWVRHGPMVEAIRASFALPGVFSPVKVEDRWLVDGALVNPVPVSVCRALGARFVIAISLSADTFGKSTIEEGLKQGTTTFDDGEEFSRSVLRAAARPDRLMTRQLFGSGSNAPGMGTVLLSALNIVMERLSRSRMAGDPPDVLISPQVGHIGLLEFERADEMIKLGEQAVAKELEAIHEAMTVLN